MNDSYNNNYQNDEQNNTIKKNNGNLIYIIIYIVIAIAIIAATIVLISVINDNNNDETNEINSNDNEQIEKTSTNLVASTTWIARDKSELVFTDYRLNWYKESNVHDDNYQSGNYNFYIGEEAIKFITTDLVDYGITEEELEELFTRATNYEKDNFIVIDILFDEYVINNHDTQISNPHTPWYGFIVNDEIKNETYLDVTNMNTKSYYLFTKQENNKKIYK